ncbi:type I-F CRISPR-associated protein Csy2 [Thiorhodococcus fuscus]|uniref:Type I-F CRISPR-associated protein Csy2 n=1 Tax=Thiorhodococcus fuscus TaxID=527200 RepID=A0ABW4Y6Z4_9GAMM
MNGDAHTPKHAAILVLPHIRVQNANAISSPMTWGFPAITAFTGAMTALERRLGQDAGIGLYGVGIICHGFEAQVTTEGFTHAFRLTRNPVLHDGSVAAIVEEGRVHLDVTLVFEARISDAHRGDAERAALAERIAHELASMRIAGGSLMPPIAGSARRPTRPTLDLLPDEDEERSKLFKRLARRWLPGFALVSRDDLLEARLSDLKALNPNANVLDAWLDLSRWSSKAIMQPTTDEQAEVPKIDWITEPRPGWIVPIPVGFAALSDLQPPGTVKGARDTEVPFCFVETIWSTGQWISPHRLQDLDELIWEAQAPDEHGLYRCRNAYRPPNPVPDPTNVIAY